MGSNGIIIKTGGNIIKLDGLGGMTVQPNNINFNINIEYNN